MAGNLTVKLKLESDEKAATAALKAAQRETKLLARDAKSASVQATAMGKSFQANANKSTAALVKMQQGLKGVLMNALALAAGGGLLSLGGNILEQADAYTNLSSRLKLVTASEEELVAVRQLLIDQAQENRVEIAAVTQLYAGITPVLKELGKSQGDILTISDSVSKSLIIGGATAAQSSASILQLTQAFASGVLRGDEFNSLMENAPALMRSLADSLGLPVGSLRKLAEEGKLTSDILANSLISQNDEIAESFGKIDVTVSTAMVNVKNSLLVYIGEANDALGFTKALSAGLQAMAADIGVAGGAIAAGLGTVVITKIVAASAASENGMIRRMKLRKAEAAVAAEAAAVSARATAVEMQAEQALAVVKAKSAAAEVNDLRRKEIGYNQALRKAKASHLEAKAALAVAQAQAVSSESAHVAALANDRYTAALTRLKAAQVASIAASGNVAAARTASAAATASAATVATAATVQTTVAARAMTVASVAGSVAVRGLSTALMLVGGPVGVAALAAIGIYAYREELWQLVDADYAAEKAVEAHKDAIDLAKAAVISYTEETEKNKKAIKEKSAEELLAAKVTLAAAKANLSAAQKNHDLQAKLGKSDGTAAFGFNMTAGDMDLNKDVLDKALASVAEQEKHLENLESVYSNLGKSASEARAAFNKDEGKKGGSGSSTLEADLKRQGDAFKKFLADKSTKTKKAAKTDAEKISEAQDAEIAGLKATQDQLNMNAIAYYKRTLELKKFAAAVIEEAVALKYRNTLLAEQVGLDKESRTSLSPKITAQYELDLENKGLNPDDIKVLSDRKIKIAFEAGYLDLRDQQSELVLTDEMYRRATLAAQGYGEEQVNQLVTQQNANTVLAAQGELLAEEIALRPKLTAAYEVELTEKGIDKRTVEVLANEKIRLSFEAMKLELEAANAEMDLGALVFERNTLSAKGYNAEQIKTIQGLKARQKATAAVKSVQETLASDERALSSSLTVGLEFELTEAGVDADTIKGLVDDKLNIAFKSLTQELDRANQEVTLGALAFRELELSALGYNEAQIKIIQNKELKTAFDAEMKSLKQSSEALSQNTAEKYKAELQAKGLSGALLDQLTAQQLQNVYDAESLALKQSTAALSQNTAEKYKAELQAKGLSGALLEQLTAQQLQGVYDAEIKSLKEANAQLGQNARDKYEAELRAKGLTGQLLKEAKAREYNNALLAEQNAIAATGSRAGLSKAETYKLDYQDQGFSADDSSALAGEKITQDFDAMKLALEDNRNQILMTADAYRLLGLEMTDGLSPKQAEFVLGMEKQNAAMTTWKDFTNDSLDSVGDNLTALAMGGETDWAGLVQNMIQEAFELAVITPIIDSLKDSFTAMFAAKNGGGASGGGGVAGMVASFVTSLFATGGAFGAGGVQYFASGGSFANSVVNTPTAFGMDGGLGVMGEAGPEAIMPLSRMSSGNLGVEVNLSGTPPFAVNVAPTVLLESAAPVTSDAGASSSSSAASASTSPVYVNITGAPEGTSVDESTDDFGARVINVLLGEIQSSGKTMQSLEFKYPSMKRAGV